MNTPEKMMALAQDHDGFAGKPDGSRLDSLEPYVSLKEIKVPEAGSGEVLVKVISASVNPSDIMYIKGMYGMPRRAGVPAGFEGVGTVVASGGGFLASRLKGKRVAFVATKSGSWAEYALTSASSCVPLREEIRDEDAAAMIVNPFTAYAMFDIVRSEGAKSFIMTAGASQLCKLIAAMADKEGFRAISIVRRDEQIEPLKQLGAAHVLNSSAEGFQESLRGLLKEEKPRIFLDAVTGDLASAIFNVMGRGSRWIVYGRLDLSPTKISEPGQLIFQEKRIEGFWLTSWMRRSSYYRLWRARKTVLDNFASGTWKNDIATVIPLAEAHSRLPEALAGANAGKVLLTA